jgi:hypothetical protein
MGMYDEEFLNKCSPSSRKYLEGLTQPIHKTGERVTIQTMTKKWKEQRSDVDHIPTHPAVMERFPGSMATRFSIHRDLSVIDSISNAPGKSDNTVTSINSGASSEGPKKKKKKRTTAPTSELAYV